ncbi:CIC11C00000002271 [Sungouiella intermedia]|uniref:CIC11C00000002271 n=1 Tax=Sungouiella intermedia TaxID=45354 RepID=A0A1L0E2D9_9ASCO|nr:CIC11C00000002271 [[Candida] intermedia]SGZ58718.1 CIC11C00000003679 [[Candida] intermedia]
MQFLTSKTLLYARVAFLLWLAFYLLKNPVAITSVNFSILLGQAMRLPIVDVSPNNPLFGVLSLFISMFAISDLIPAIADNIAYFETLIPSRLFAFFALGGFCMISDYSLIANNLVFTYSFLEIWIHFLIFNNLRDEKYYRAKHYLEEHGEELRDHVASQVVPVE